MTEEELKELSLILDEYLIYRQHRKEFILNGRVENLSIVLAGFITKIKNGDDSWTAPKAALPL